MPPQPDSHSHIADAFRDLPSDQAELMQLLGMLYAPDMPTPIIAHMLKAVEEKGEGEGTVNAEDVAGAATRLRSLAERGLAVHIPGSGSEPDRWSLTPEQNEFARRQVIDQITADIQELNQWIEAAPSDPQGGAESQEEVRPDPAAEAVGQMFGVEADVTKWQGLRDMFQESGDLHCRAAVSNNLGCALHEAGRFTEAVAALEEAERLYGRAGDEPRRERAARKLGEARGRAGS